MFQATSKTLYFKINFILVVKHYVWKPNSLAGNIECLNSSILIWIPLEFVVIPILMEKTNPLDK